MGRAPCCDKANVKRGPWAPEEDVKLKAYIEKYGTGGNWIALPQKIGLKRCGKSCRLRWLNYLRPNIKHGGFTEEEDNTILSLYISIGSRWSIIAAQLPGRTDNDIKNYWNTKLKKKMLGRRKQPKLCGGGEPSSMEDGPSYTPTLSNSALERLQLHMQLQSLQNPVSFHNNPTLWPKLHPLQEKMIHGLQSSFDKITTNAGLIEQLVSLNPSDYNLNPTQGEGKAESYDKTNNLQVEEVENSFNGSTSSDNSMANFHHGVEIHTNSSFGPNELHELLSNDHKVEPEELDCFKSVEASKEAMTMMNWWSNDQFNAMPWDSSSSSLQPSSDSVAFQLQDYPLGY